jgi:SulP family sulfate permease
MLKSDLTNKFLNQIKPSNFYLEISSGIMMSIMSIAYGISCAALIFKGPIETYLPLGIGIGIFSCLIFGLLGALLSNFKIAIWIPGPNSAAILAIPVSTVAYSILSSNQMDSLLPTVLSLMFVTSLLSGLTFFAIGYFQLSQLVRFIPHTVVGGFIAGTGCLIIKGGFVALTGLKISPETLSNYFSYEMLLRWLPSLFLAVSILALSRRYKNPLILPGSIIASVILFYILAQILQVPVHVLEANNWLIGPFPDAVAWTPISPDMLFNAEWKFIAENMLSVIAVVMISSIAILFNSTTIELNTNTTININKELMLTGTANIASSFAGGLVGYHSLSLCTLNSKMGTNGRFPGLVLAICCAIALFGNIDLLGYFPRPVIGAVLLYLGLSFLADWVIDGYKKLPISDYFIVIFIILCILQLGFLQGIGIGLIAAVFFFCFRYSQITVIKQELFGTYHRSNRERSGAENEYLEKNGDQLYIARLQGFIFFGSANKILTHMQGMLETKPFGHIKFLLLDFTLVNGLDSSAILSFKKLETLLNTKNIQLAFSNLTDDDKSKLIEGGCIPAHKEPVYVFEDRDHGLEYFEDQILQDHYNNSEKQNAVSSWLKEILGSSASIKIFKEYLTTVKIGKGEVLFSKGENGDKLFFIDSGLVKITLKSVREKEVRLAIMGPGAIIGDMSLFTLEPRTANAIAEQDTFLYEFSKTKLDELTKKHPKIAHLFQAYIIKVLSGRLKRSNDERQQLL